jgi:hypothetical protein
MNVSRKSFSSSNSETLRINQALGYTDVELDANRQGKMTEKQTSAIISDATKVARMAGITLAILIVIAVLAFNGTLNSLIDQLFRYTSASSLNRFKVLGSIALGLGILFAGGGLVQALIGYYAVRYGKVLRYEGIVTKEVSTDNKVKSHYLRFHGLKRLVPPHIYDLFRHEKQYVIYHLENYPSILSVEAVDPIFKE